MSVESSQTPQSPLASAEECARVLSKIPQQKPFRFIDEIVELSQTHIVARYRYREDEYFYEGHFPGEPVTPGVILVETIAQAALVALGIYLLEAEDSTAKMRTLFTDCAVDFHTMVMPGTLVTVTGERVFWRRHKLKSKVQMILEDGTIAASGFVSGQGVFIK